MSADLQSRLTSYFNELADTTTVADEPPPLDTVRVGEDPGRGWRRPQWIAAAAALALLAGAGLTYAVVDRNHGSTAQQSAPATDNAPIPAGDPVLFRPANAELTLASRVEPGSASSGTVLSPTGQAIYLEVAHQHAQDPTSTPESRVLGGINVQATTNENAPGQMYYSILSGCVAVGLTTTDLPKWDGSVAELIAALHLDADTASVDLPAGWTSLGGGTQSAQYSAMIDVGGQSVSLEQRPNTAVGALMFSEAPMSARDVDGRTAWIGEAVSVPGYTTLVGERDGTAIRLGGRASAEQLVDLFRSLVRAPEARWTGSGGAQDVTTMTYEVPPAGCTVPPLVINAPG